MSRRGPREIHVRIASLGEDGLGHGSFESRQVRARNALPGESVDVRVLKRRRGVWYGEADTPEARTALRRQPPCPAFPRCGGCVMQHLDYAAQLAHKQALLRAALDDHRVSAARYRPPVSGPRFHYRCKARLGVRMVGEELLAGFREGFSSRVARLEDCLVLAQPLARMIPGLKRTLGKLSRPDQVPQVELAGGDRDYAMVVRHLTELERRDLEVLETFERQNGIRVYLQPGGYDTVARLNGRQGSDLLSYVIPDFGLCFEFLPTDFTQVNPWMNRALVRATLLGLAAPRHARVVDLFCGIGNFSLALARQGARVVGLESSPGAVERARHNAALNRLSGRAEFAVADLYDSRSPGIGEADFMVLDPPRSGAGPNLARWVLGAPGLQRIAYVSCNPQTFAADAAVLEEQGFELEEAGVFDMFPHTAHVEVLGVFSRRVTTRG